MSCGTGERQRGYWCQLENHVIAKSYCYPVRPPVHKEACHMGDCPQWHATQWGQVHRQSAHPKFTKKITITKLRDKKQNKMNDELFCPPLFSFFSLTVADFSLYGQIYSIRILYLFAHLSIATLISLSLSLLCSSLVSDSPLLFITTTVFAPSGFRLPSFEHSGCVNCL